MLRPPLCRCVVLLALVTSCRPGTADVASTPARSVWAPTPRLPAVATTPQQEPPPLVPEGATRTPSAPRDRLEAFDPGVPVDILIAGGRVVDGSGSAPVLTDVVIDAGRIRHVGPTAESLVVRQRIDARGAVVAPGFIDLHAHGDPQGANANALAMGVTTLCVGQDGNSVEGVSLRELADRLGTKSLALNIAPLTGHATARLRTGVGHTNAPNRSQIARMAEAVARDLADGAFGLSTGLEYDPGRNATREELVALARPVAAADAVVMSHLRSEDDESIDASIDELIAQAETGGARVHIAHLKVVRGVGRNRAERILARLDAARRRGIEVTADAYPYDASYTTVGILFPAFARPPNDYRRIRATRNTELLHLLRQRVSDRGGPERVLFGSGPFAGRTLAAAAHERAAPFEAVLAEIGPGGGDAAFFVMDAAIQERLLVDPSVSVGSDGSSTSAHPRGAGTFARVLRQLVVEKRLLPIEEAVRKMTGLAANILRLDRLGRGRLVPGAAADVIVFDLDTVRDEATYSAPRRLATGMRWVLVNGVIALADGVPTRARAGRLLLRH